MRSISLLLSFGLMLGCGCGGSQPSSGPSAPSISPPPVSAGADLPGQAQPTLPWVDLFLGPHRLKAEVARTADQIRTGMMFRERIGDDEGMLFVFGRPHEASFWMKNVTVELSVAYLDPDGRLLEIHDLVPGEEIPVKSTAPNVQFALETSRGWFARKDVRPGTLVRTDSGSLQDSFVRRGMAGVRP